MHLSFLNAYDVQTSTEAEPFVPSWKLTSNVSVYTTPTRAFMMYTILADPSIGSVCNHLPFWLKMAVMLLAFLVRVKFISILDGFSCFQSRMFTIWNKHKKVKEMSNS